MAGLASDDECALQDGSRRHQGLQALGWARLPSKL